MQSVDLKASLKFFVLSAILVMLTLGRPAVMAAQTSNDEDDTGRAYFSQVQVNYPNGGVKQFDLRTTPSCSAAVLDQLSNTCDSNNFTQLTSTSTYFTSTAPTASSNQLLTVIFPVFYTLSIPPAFTVEVGLDTTASVTDTQTVFAIYPHIRTSGTSILFSLMRDNQGFWYTGKPSDGPSPLVHYLNRAWDPVSPCVVANVCTSDTMYITFLGNGQILLDEVAVFANPSPNRVSWMSGMLNYGLPVTGYQAGGLITPPTDAPLFSALGLIALGTLPQSLYPTTPSGTNGFTAARLTRLALWTGGTAGTGYSISHLRTFMMNDQQASLPPGYMDATWVPCNSGSFQVISANTRSAYSPQSMHTPCNAGVPDAPQGFTGSYTFYQGYTDASFTCIPPRYSGGLPITDYETLVDGNNVDGSSCVFEWGLGVSALKQSVSLTAYAKNAAGTSPPLQNTLIIGAPMPPTLSSFSNTADTLLFACTPPIDGGLSNITSYKFSVNGGATTSSNTCSIEFSGYKFATGTAYTITAYAVNDLGNGLPLQSTIIIK